MIRCQIEVFERVKAVTNEVYAAKVISCITLSGIINVNNRELRLDWENINGI
jgi:hypothetical protein